IAIASSVLPTHFITFDAVENNSIVNLKWTVENESSVNKYEIERSTDGINYSKINEIKSSGNAGANSYSVPDNVSSVLSNQIFYRIKQYDQNGSYFFSKTIAIKRNKILPIVVYPNPVIKSLYVNIASTSVDHGVISVTNSIGAEVISQQVHLTTGNNSFTVDRVSGLPSGTYQLSVKLNSGKVMIKQFSKQ
ncbi:MAG: T9SS type A sorting domain-containing protein, partial [Parafilimonas sp.]